MQFCLENRGNSGKILTLNRRSGFAPFFFVCRPRDARIFLGSRMLLFQDNQVLLELLGLGLEIQEGKGLSTL